MHRVNRRDFLRAGGAVAGMTTLTRGVLGAKRGANDTIRAAVIGVYGQGKKHINELSRLDGVDVVALCDVDKSILHQRADALETQAGRKVARYGDLRALLDDKSIDVVTIATPNHWHTLAGIWAMQAGKDAYVEKPLSHNIWEGRQLVKAARRYKRMCQHGTQGRTAPAIQEAVQKLREGVIGDVYMARGICYKWRPSIVNDPRRLEPAPGEKVPAQLDWNLWQGPAQEREFSSNYVHYNWHWFWDYGNGDIGNQGVHEMDIARWGLGVGLPQKVQAMGGRFLFHDGKEVPNVLTTSFSYPQENKLLEFEVRPWIGNHESGFTSGNKNDLGVLFYGSEGYMAVRYFEYKTFLGQKREPGPSQQSTHHRFERFIAGVRSRKIEDLGVDVEEGHLTVSLCHLANAAYRMGRSLEFDADTEKFVGDADANQMLKRTYRTPFAVPETI